MKKILYPLYRLLNTLQMFTPSIGFSGREEFVRYAIVGKISIFITGVVTFTTFL